MNETVKLWTIMTRTRGGTVSMLKDLTEDQARSAMQRLRRPFDTGSPWNSDARIGDERRRREAKRRGHGWWSNSLGSRLCQDGDLEQIECWGPGEEALEVWPKPADWDDRWAIALAELDAEEAANPPQPPPPPVPELRAADYGLPDHVRISTQDRMWRCNQCRDMQVAKNIGAWIPDRIQKQDNREALTNVALEDRWNGHASLWCLPCCEKWTEGSDPAGEAKRTSFLAKFLGS